MLALADIFRRYGPAYRAPCADRMLPSHLAARAAMAQCRMAALGGQLYQCAECGERADSYHSGTNRHGPKCQHAAATHWLEQPRALLLPVPYFLVTFTLPEALRPLARSQQRLMYNLRFQTSAAALTHPGSGPPLPRWADRHGGCPPPVDPGLGLPSACPFQCPWWGLSPEGAP